MTSSAIHFRVWANFLSAHRLRDGQPKIIEICLDEIEAIEQWTDDTCMISMKSGKQFWVFHTKEVVRSAMDDSYKAAHERLKLKKFNGEL